MQRDVDINEISDGKLYKVNDMVKCSTGDCQGCYECCQFVMDTIILDPYDCFELSRATGRDFYQLIEDNLIELNMADHVLLPNIKMNGDKGCSFLQNGRCSIHNYRPGFCRLFPLGRIYENGSFSYFLQVNECSHITGAKVKIKKWLGIDNIKEYEKFVLIWHDHLEKLREEVVTMQTDEASKMLSTFLKHYYGKVYDTSGDFYRQFYERLL